MEVLSIDMTGQLDIVGNYCDAFCMDGTQVGIVQGAGQVILCCFLQCHDHMHLEVQVISSPFFGYCANETCKGVFVDEELSAHLVLADFVESHCPWPVPLGSIESSFLLEFLAVGLPSQQPVCSAMSLPLPPSALCWVGNDLGDLPAFSNLSTFFPPPQLILQRDVPTWGPSPNHPWCHLHSHHSGMEKQEIKDCSGLFQGCTVLIFRATENLFWNWHNFLGKWQRSGVRLHTSWRGRTQFQGAMKGQVGTTFSQINNSHKMWSFKHLLVLVLSPSV